MDTNKKSYLYAAITVMIWATNAPVSKLLLNSFPNMQALFIAGAVGSVFLLLWNLLTGHIRKMKDYSLRDYGIMAGLGFLGVALYSALYFLCISNLTSQTGCIINYLWPAFIVLFSTVILREKMTVLKAAAIAMSFAGVVVICTGGGTAGASGNVPLGIAGGLGAAVTYGLFSVLNKKYDFDQQIAMMIYWAEAALLGLVSGLFSEAWIPVRGTQWIGFLWLGILVNAVGYLWWALALRGVKNSALVANLAFLVPFLSLVVGRFLLGERVNGRAFIALVLIVGGIVLQDVLPVLASRRKHGE